MGTRMRGTPARVSGVLADSVKADSPANGRPVFRGELSFERAERSTWRVLCRGIGCGESNFPCIPTIYRLLKSTGTAYVVRRPHHENGESLTVGTES